MWRDQCERGHTVTELRVLLAIVEVGGAPEVADVPGIAGRP
jgi:hypothetical protein